MSLETESAGSAYLKVAKGEGVLVSVSASVLDVSLELF